MRDLLKTRRLREQPAAIISVSLMFHLQLGYLKENGQSTVYGEATLTVEIEILMFSMEVSVSCRKEFAGEGDIP